METEKLNNNSRNTVLRKDPVKKEFIVIRDKNVLREALDSEYPAILIKGDFTKDVKLYYRLHVFLKVFITIISVLTLAFSIYMEVSEHYILQQLKLGYIVLSLCCFIPLLMSLIFRSSLYVKVNKAYKTVGENVKITDRMNVSEEMYIEMVHKKKSKSQNHFNDIIDHIN